MMEPFQMERYTLAKGKLSEISGASGSMPDEYQEYFKKQADFLLNVCEAYEYLCEYNDSSVSLKELSVDKLKQFNTDLYNDILVCNYDDSFCNPTLTVSRFGEGVGRIFSLVAYEMRATIPFAFEGKGLHLLMRLELLIEIYCMVASSFEDGEQPSSDCLKDSIDRKSVV